VCLTGKQAFQQWTHLTSRLNCGLRGDDDHLLGGRAASVFGGSGRGQLVGGLAIDKLFAGPGSDTFRS
jgi:Ca2+-binding RTX toxin-like protein